MKLLIGKYNITFIISAIRNITILFLLYLFIFNPPFKFMPFGFTKFFYIAGLIYLIYKSKLNTYISAYISILGPLFVFICYTLIIQFVTFSEASFALINIFILFESFITAYVISLFLVQIYENKADKMVMWVIIIASLISIIMISNPSLNSYVRDTLLMEAKENIEHIVAFRAFGLAEDLLYTFAIVLGIGICLCFKYAKINKCYYIGMIPMVIGVLFNARIGIVPVILYLFYLIVIKHKFSIIVYIFLFLLVVIPFLLNTSFGEEYELTINWILDGYNEICNIFTGEQSEKNTNTETLQSMIVFPESISGFIFGTGKDIFLDPKRNSDIGYILQINFGGIIYLLLFLLIILKLLVKLLINNMTDKWFNYIFVGTILLCNIKGLFFYTCSGMRVLMILFYIYILLPKYRLDTDYIR